MCINYICQGHRKNSGRGRSLSRIVTVYAISNEVIFGDSCVPPFLGLGLPRSQMPSRSQFARMSTNSYVAVLGSSGFLVSQAWKIASDCAERL
jgi:hypothetical protein